jgi:hypothetical protein
MRLRPPSRPTKTTALLCSLPPCSFASLPRVIEIDRHIQITKRSVTRGKQMTTQKSIATKQGNIAHKKAVANRSLGISLSVMFSTGINRLRKSLQTKEMTFSALR